jgi:dTDP-4-dehydrorhamnose reductase
MGLKGVVVIGANGQLGHDLVKRLHDWELIPLTRKEVDLCDFVQTRRTLTAAKPALVINTAAFTRVDECEDGADQAFAVNTYAVRNLAQICAELDSVLMHLSTDYVFGGEQRTPYIEADSPNPLNVYGVSKLAGEYFVRNICPKHFVMRTSGLYGVMGSSGKGGNFVETLLRLSREGKPIRVVDDQVLTPTYTHDLARQIKALAQTDAHGLYHMTNGGQCSWYEFASTIFELLGVKPDFGPTTTAAYGAKARRPAYSVLAHANLRHVGLDDLRPWPEALAAYLAEKGYR